MPSDASRPRFFFDVSSPYAYLAAERIDELLPVAARWVPISFGWLNRQTGRVPWSLRAETRDEGIAAVQRRASGRGLAPLRWPEGWPARSYSLLPLRAIVFAARRGAERRLALELFRAAFVRGIALNDPAVVGRAAQACGLDPAELLEGVGEAGVKGELTANTDEALALGVVGVPTVAVGERLFWGDDRLEDAAAALA